MKQVKVTNTIEMPKRVTIEEAENGYIVSGYDRKGKHIQLVCKTMAEAHEAMMSMMGSEKKMAESYHETKAKSSEKMLKHKKATME